MKAYFKKTWWEYLLLVLLCIAAPLLIRQLAPNPLISFPSAISIWYYIAMPVLCSAVIAAASRKLGDFDWAALAVMELLLLLHLLIMNGFSLGSSSDMPIYLALILASIPALATFLVGGIASAIALKAGRA